MTRFDYSPDDPVTYPIGSLPRAMGLLAWRERHADPCRFPKGTSEDEIQSYVLWTYLLHVRGSWKVRARSIRPPLAFRLRVRIHQAKRALLKRAQGSEP